MNRPALLNQLLTAITVGLLLVISSCEGDDGPPPAARATMDAAIAEAEQTDVSNPTREYAQQLCGPYETLIEEMEDVAYLFEDMEGDEIEDMGSFLVMAEALKDPMKRLADDLEEITPPKELQDYHRETLAGFAYAAEAMNLISEGGLFAAMALGDAPPTPEEPPDLEAALILECGEQFLSLLEGEYFSDLLDESDTDGGEADATEESEARADVAVGDDFAVDAEALGEVMGEGSLSGTLSVRVRDVELLDAIDASLWGPQEAKGKFVVLHYDVTSDLNRRMQPATQINDALILTDQRGREWEAADYQGDYFSISGDAAETRGCDQPETWLGAGFSSCTAVVFDVPEDAGGFSLLWEEAGVQIDLGQ